jgi:hypothetical protein
LAAFELGNVGRLDHQSQTIRESDLKSVAIIIKTATETL